MGRGTRSGLTVNDLSMGIPGVGEIHPGAHLCALYSGPDERDRLLVPFMQEGRRHGDRCVCLIDDVEPASMRQQAYGPPPPGDARRPGDLGVDAAYDVHLRAGEFSVEQMIAFLAASLASSTDDDFPVLRAAGEMSWVLHEPGASELFGYESAVDQIVAQLPALFLCLYDRQRFGVGMLVNVLRTHSQVLLDGMVLHNPHCLAPTDYPQPTPDAVTRYPLARLRSVRLDGGDHWLSLTGAEVRVAELVASGMTNRAMAEELIVSPHTVDAHLKHMYVKLGIHSRVELTVLALQHGPRAS
jgi:DNA-binding CsgD family transcriptional regulator